MSAAGVGDAWSCSVCTFDNDATASVCAICQMARPAGDGGEGEGRKMGADDLKWSCACCTFENDMNTNACAMCSHRLVSEDDTDNAKSNYKTLVSDNTPPKHKTKRRKKRAWETGSSSEEEEEEGRRDGDVKTKTRPWQEKERTGERRTEDYGGAENENAADRDSDSVVELEGDSDLEIVEANKKPTVRRDEARKKRPRREPSSTVISLDDDEEEASLGTVAAARDDASRAKQPKVRRKTKKKQEAFADADAEADVARDIGFNYGRSRITIAQDSDDDDDPENAELIARMRAAAATGAYRAKVAMGEEKKKDDDNDNNDDDADADEDEDSAVVDEDDEEVTDLTGLGSQTLLSRASSTGSIGGAKLSKEEKKALADARREEKKQEKERGKLAALRGKYAMGVQAGKYKFEEIVVVLDHCLDRKCVQGVVQQLEGHEPPLKWITAKAAVPYSIEWRRLKEDVLVDEIQATIAAKKMKGASSSSSSSSSFSSSFSSSSSSSSSLDLLPSSSPSSETPLDRIDPSSEGGDLSVVFLYLPADKFCEMVTTETLDDMLDRLQRRRVRWNVTVLVDGLYSMVQSKRNHDFQRSVNPLAPVSAAAQKAAEKLRMLPFARTEDVDDYREKQRFARGVNFAFFDSTKQCCEYLKTVTRQLAKSRYDVHDSRVALAKSRPTAAMRVESMLESSQHSNSSGGDIQSLSRSQSGSQASGLSRTNSNSIYSDLPRYERTFAHSWVNWWMQVPGISESKASAIVTKYPTLRRLLMAYANARASSSSVSPEQLLQDVRIASSDRPRLGPVISKKVFAILHSTDPHVNIQ